MLGLLGDMLIASPLPKRIRDEHPHVHVTWLVDEANAPILRMNPFVDEVLIHDWEAAAQPPSRRFDAVVTGDSFGFHLALAHDRPTVLLLGPSDGAEVIPKHVTGPTLRSTLPCSP